MDLQLFEKAQAGAALNTRQAEDLALELFVVGYDGEALPQDYAQLLERGLTGTILFRRNFHYDAAGSVDIAQVCEHTRQIYDAARAQPSGLPIVSSVDQEGGAVARLRAPFSLFPPMRQLGERGDRDLIAQVGAQLGRELSAAGFNVDYAPVLDVDTNPANPIIGNRSFSRDPEQVAEFAAILLQALQANGVTGCGKHFPGHGDTDADSHLELPVLRHDLARLKAVELVPFSRLRSDLRLVMTAHVLFPELNAEMPATLAPEILGPLLRVHCGYQGVIVSDDLEMQGIAKVLDPAGCVRRGLAAGVDLFLVCRRRDVLDQAWLSAAQVLSEPANSPLRQRALNAIGRVRSMRAGLAAHRPSLQNLRAVLADDQTQRLRDRLWAGTLVE